jgi:hypothetical protein
VQHPDWWERFRYWLVNGGPGKAPATLTCRNGHHWAHSVNAVGYLARDSGWRWLRLPARLLRVILAQRRMHPVPLTYLMAAGVGVILGLILDLVLGWPWWAVAGGFVFFVWLFFLSSAFRGQDLAYRLLCEINPERATARAIQRLKDDVASGSLVGYEVDGWKGEKTIPGWGHPIHRSLEIRHGPFPDDAEWVEVTTHIGAEDPRASSRVQHNLEMRLLDSQFPGPHDLDREDLRRWEQERQQAIRQAERPSWKPARFRLEDVTITGQIARSGTYWVAYFKTGETLIELAGNRVDPDQVRLTRVTTLDSYKNPLTR